MTRERWADGVLVERGDDETRTWHSPDGEPLRPYDAQDNADADAAQALTARDSLRADLSAHTAALDAAAATTAIPALALVLHALADTIRYLTEAP